MTAETYEALKAWARRLERARLPLRPGERIDVVVDRELPAGVIRLRTGALPAGVAGEVRLTMADFADLRRRMNDELPRELAWPA